MLSGAQLWPTYAFSDTDYLPLSYNFRSHAWDLFDPLMLAGTRRAFSSVFGALWSEMQ